MLFRSVSNPAIRTEILNTAGLLTGPEKMLRFVSRLFSNVSDDGANPIRLAWSDQALGRPSQPFHGPAGDRDGRPLSQREPRRLKSNPRASADDDHSVSIKSHDEIPRL